jgi:hypothetical protein
MFHRADHPDAILIAAVGTPLAQYRTPPVTVGRVDRGQIEKGEVWHPPLAGNKPLCAGSIWASASKASQKLEARSKK